MNAAEQLKMIDDFEAHYRYDGTYMRELLECSPEGYAKFADFLPLAAHREWLGRDEYWVAKIAAMQVEDCGDCLQLNVRMALEAGVPKALVEALIKGGAELPEALREVYAFAKGVAANTLIDQVLIERIWQRYDKGGLLELGLCVATAKMFPTIKRALGYTRSCSLIAIEVSV